MIFALSDAPRMSARGLIRILPTLIEKRREESAFLFYVAECTRLIGKNTAGLSNGSYIDVKLTDLLKPKENKTAEEITSDLVGRLGLVKR